MTDSRGTIREIVLGNDFGTVAMTANDSTTKAGAAPQIGDLMPNGGVYVGKSATTGQDLYAAPADEPRYLDFDGALAAAEKMRRKPGRENAHVPTLEELNENLYKNKDAGKLRGTFNTSGSFPESCYRSSSRNAPPFDRHFARVQWFHDGRPHWRQSVVDCLSVRLVW